MSADASSLLESVETSDDWAARCLAPVKHQALSVRSIDSSGLPLGPHRVLSTAGTFGSPLNSDPTISIADASITEGGAGPTELEFEVTLSAAATDTVRIDVEVVAQSANRLVTERLARGLSEPVFLTSAPGDQQTLFVVEQDGVIKRINRDTGDVASTPFLTVTDLSTGGERGLLGLAFHPQYESNRYLYIYMTDSGGDTLIRRYTANENGLTANPASVVPVLGFEQPFSNHNAGWMDFGPDGFLYIASGDGGSGNDPRNNAQDTTNNLLGKILRLDVDQDDFPTDPDRNYGIPATNPFVGESGDDEIWAYGLRNPWRNSFDRETGDLIIADVGQGEREEINLQPSTSQGGENYGWRPREGTIATPNIGGPRPDGAIDPIYDYTHGSGANEGFSVTGGYVYRGPIPELRGQYFFADFVTERIWSIRPNDDAPSQFDGTNFSDFTDWTSLLLPDAGSISDISSFGEDNDGNLYILDRQGEVFVISQGADYQVTTASITIDEGESAGTFQVDVLGDRFPEPNETFTVNLTGSMGAVIGDGTATGTILNDDAPAVKQVSFGGVAAGRSQITEIVVNFDSEVSIDANTDLVFQLANQTTSDSVDLTPTVSVVDGETLATLRFAAGPSTEVGVNGSVMLVDGFYELSILSGGIQVGGLALDGDGDGVPGGSMVLGQNRSDGFFRLFGDRDGDGDVDSDDLARLRSAFSSQVGDENFDAAFDHNDDGRIDVIDLSEFRRRLGRSI